MDDQTPHNPLDDRLRATFAAERTDIERRHLAAGIPVAPARSRTWIPFAVAAAVLAIVGLVFVGNRGSDQAVELDVAAEPTSTVLPDTTPAVDATPEPDSPTPDPTPSSVAAQPTGLDPAEIADNECGQAVPLVPHFIWDIPLTDPDGGLVAHTEAGVEAPITRVIPIGGVVVPTRGCVRTVNGSAWYQLYAPGGSTEWVNARYLQATEPACIVGEQTSLPAGLTGTEEEPFFHTVQVGDRLSTIAEKYNVTVELLIRANPDMDPNVIINGMQLLVPGATTIGDAVVGPLDGWAAADGSRIAFFESAEPTEAELIVPPSDAMYRWFSTTGVAIGPCPTTLDDDRCTRVADSVRSAGESRRWSAGETSSVADHVHDIRTESNEDCTRIIVTFGTNANEDSDGEASVLPPVIVDQTLQSVRITADGWQMESAFMDTDRVDYDGGIGLLTLSPGFEFAVELMHREMEPHVRFMDDPARIVVDLFPAQFPNSRVTGPFGDRFVLRAPIQKDRTGLGVPADEPIVVEGFGRPFEASGLYRIWRVDAGVDAGAFLVDPPAPMVQQFFPTFGSAEAWGMFQVELPQLSPGTYIALFGELPPTDEIGFYGAGQLFRIADAPTEEPGGWPEATLLPDVQLPPE